MWGLVWSPEREDTSHYLGLRVYSRPLVDQDLSDVDFILLGSQVERSQTGLGTDRETEFKTWMKRHKQQRS